MSVIPKLGFTSFPFQSSLLRKEQFSHPAQGADLSSPLISEWEKNNSRRTDKLSEVMCIKRRRMARFQKINKKEKMNHHLS